MNYSINVPEGFENSIARGSASISVSVKGYWSSDVITLYVRRDYFDNGFWKLDLSHSSGGRDTGVVTDDLEAEVYFGEALIAAAQYGKELKARFPEFEEIYQARSAQYAAQMKAEKEAKEAKLASDPEYGQEAAEKLVKIFKIDCDKTLVVYDRAVEESTQKFNIIRAFGSAQQQFISTRGVRFTRNELIARVAMSSKRTALV